MFQDFTLKRFPSTNLTKNSFQHLFTSQIANTNIAFLYYLVFSFDVQRESVSATKICHPAQNYVNERQACAATQTTHTMKRMIKKKDKQGKS